MHAPLWQSYFAKQLAKMLLLVFFSLYFLYLFIDISTHSRSIFQHTQFFLFDLCTYSLMLMSKRASLILTLSLIIATIQVLCRSNRHNELLALQTTGLSLFSLARPFFFASFCCCALHLYNAEYLLPSYLTSMNRFEKTHFKGPKTHTKPGVHTLFLPGEKRLIYQRYDPKRERFIDVFLLVSFDEIWHSKTLCVAKRPPTGFFVEKIARNSSGIMEKKASFARYVFSDLSVDFSTTETPKDLLETQSLSQLFRGAFLTPSASLHFQAKAKTHLYSHIATSFFPFLIVLGIFPFCIASKRHLPVFLIFSISIFSYVFLFAFSKACLILGENQVLAPHISMFGVPLILFLLFGTHFMKKCKGSTWIVSLKPPRGI